MSDRPEYDPEKNYESWRRNWDRENYDALLKKSLYLMTEIEKLQKSYDERLELMQLQIDTLFQLTEKLLRESMDHSIEYDLNQTRFENVDNRLINLEAAFAIWHKELYPEGEQ